MSNTDKYPVIRESEYYYSFETEHFYFDVYKSWNSCSDKKQSMFRAGSYVKKSGDKKYYIDFALFAECDYKDKKSAFEAAKQWIFNYIKSLKKELTN